MAMHRGTKTHTLWQMVLYALLILILGQLVMLCSCAKGIEHQGCGFLFDLQLHAGLCCCCPSNHPSTIIGRYGLYVAEALHARVLPLQFISFADSWAQVQAAAQSSVIIAGQDGGFNGLWLW